jgi:thymidylate synthase (FAD)
MKIIPPSFVIEDPDYGERGWDVLRRIERCGRTCYKSEGQNARIGYMDGVWDRETTRKFIKMLIERGHESVLEHEKVTVRIVCDRGVSHELVRHRLASYSQESTRYCNYSQDKFGNELTFIDIRPHLANPEARKVWETSIQQAEANYMELINQHGVPPQFARSILPNSLKTEIVTTANVREWRHIFKLRTSKAAHPQMREIMTPMLKQFQERFPVLFDDIEGGA